MLQAAHPCDWCPNSPVLNTVGVLDAARHGRGKPQALAVTGESGHNHGGGENEEGFEGPPTAKDNGESGGN